jgi:hypothetical protein
MGNVILGMTMSLDGFVEDRRKSVEALYADLTILRTSALIDCTGAAASPGQGAPCTMTKASQLVNGVAIANGIEGAP